MLKLHLTLYINTIFNIKLQIVRKKHYPGIYLPLRVELENLVTDKHYI